MSQQSTSKPQIFIRNDSRSFTLIELLVVLGLIAILASILIAILNPIKIFQNARDSQRIADLNNLDKALTVILTETEGKFKELQYASANIVYISLPDPSANCSSWLSQLPSLPSGWSYQCSATPTNINGTGWIPIPFNQFSLINLSKLPIDPINKPPYYYSFVAGGSYELTAALESDANKGKDKAGGKDGGDHNFVYELGTNKKLTLSSVQARAESESLKQGLVGWWTFDEGSGTIANDLSGNGNNGTLYNGPQWVDGKVGKALSFDGVDDWVEVLHSGSLAMNRAISICAWVVPYPSQTMIRKNYNDYLFEWGLGNSNNPGTTPQWFLLTSAGNSYIYGNSPLTEGKWYFVCGVYDSDKQIQEIYVNGSVYPSSGTKVWGIINNLASYLRIGNWSNEIFKGTIDEVRIYNRALSADEIKTLYEATR